MNENLVKILYFSQLDKPKIHFTIGNLQDEVIGSQHWDQYLMKKSITRDQLYEIELLLDSDQYLEFVFCGGKNEKISWENPRGDQHQKYTRKGNFFINRTGSFAVFEGFIVQQQEPPIITQPLALFTDIDGTLFGDSPHIFQLFKKFYIGSGFLDHPKVTLIYSTGRGLSKLKKILEDEKLIIPDYLISSCGSEVYSVNKAEGSFTLNDEWKEYITLEGKGWDLKALYTFVQTEMPELIINNDEGKNLFKGQFVTQEQNVRDRSRLDKMMKDAYLALGQDWKYVISGRGTHRFIDILPERADKGTSLRFLCKRVLQYDKQFSVAFGDSANDIEMLIEAGRGFAVSNSQPDLLYWLQENFALYPTISLSPYKESESIVKFLSSAYQIDPSRYYKK